MSGYLGSSFTKYPIIYFGHKLPHWGWDAPALKEICSMVHLTSATLLIALIALHVTAALKHWLVDRDGIMQRMSLSRAAAERAARATHLTEAALGEAREP